MNRKKKTEKRLHPRVKKELPLKILANGYDFSTTTANVSCVGAYCRIEKYIPPFTKVFVKLSLPMKRYKARNNTPVECTGVVVRTEDEEQGGFNLAIFFNDIKESQRQRIAQYVNQLLSENA